MLLRNGNIRTMHYDRNIRDQMLLLLRKLLGSARFDNKHDPAKPIGLICYFAAAWPN